MKGASADAELLPRGPRMPAVLQSLAWLLWPVRFIEKCRQRFGPSFTLRMAGLPPVVVLSDPAAVKEVLTGDPSVFHAGDANAMLKPTTWLRSFGARSLLLLDDERHRRERALMLPAFHGDRMQTYRRVMRAETDAAIDAWPIGRPFALHPEMQRLVLDIFLAAIFGLHEGPRHTALRDAFVALLELGEHPGLVFLVARGGALRGRAVLEHVGRVPRWASFQSIVDRVDGELRAEIVRRRNGGSESDVDVLALLLSAQDESGNGLDEASLIDQLKTLLLAGHEATANAITWSMLELMEHPLVLARLEREIDRNDDYLDAVIRETLRLHAVVPIVARKLTADAIVGGRAYPAGTVLAPSIHLIQRDEAMWKDARRFDPERFLGSKIAAHELVAFGGGARRCLGTAFALIEMRTVLRQLVTRGRLRLAPRYRPRVVPRGISFAVAEGLPVVRDA
jgi:cytochrome P450 family 135